MEESKKVYKIATEWRWVFNNDRNITAIPVSECDWINMDKLEDLVKRSLNPYHHITEEINDELITNTRLLCEAYCHEPEKENETDGLKRLYQYFDANSNQWRTGWIDVSPDCLHWYKITTENITFDQDLYSHTGNFVSFESEPFYVIAGCEEEAKALFILKKLHLEDVLVNGWLAIEDIVRKYGYDAGWSSLDVEEWNSQKTDLELERWCKLHLGYWDESVGLVCPTSLWGLQDENSGWLLREAYDWVSEVTSYYDILEDDSFDQAVSFFMNGSSENYRSVGLVPFDEVIKNSNEYSFWEEDDGYHVFLDNHDNLVRNGVLKLYNKGNWCLHALSPEDAETKFYTYQLIDCFHGRTYPRNESWIGWVQKFSDEFFARINLPLVCIDESLKQNYTCIDIPEGFIQKQIVERVTSRKKNLISAVCGKAVEKKHVFSIMQSMNCYILHGKWSNIIVGTGMNSFDAAGEVGLSSDYKLDNISQNGIHCYSRYENCISPYKVGYSVRYSIPFDSMAMYWLFYDKNKGGVES